MYFSRYFIFYSQWRIKDPIFLVSITLVPHWKTAKKGFGRFFQNPFAKKTAREGAETIATKGTKIGLRKILGKLFGPIVNFLVDLSFGEKVERALAGAAGFAGASAFAAKLFCAAILSHLQFR